MSVCVVYVCMCVYMCMCACTFIQGSMAWCRCSESLIAARLPCCFLVLSIVLGPPPLTDIFSKSEAQGFLQLRPFGDVSADAHGHLDATWICPYAHTRPVEGRSVTNNVSIGTYFCPIHLEQLGVHGS